jgi:hypothetical protein
VSERIVAAAVMFHGINCVLPPPARHHTILHAIHALNEEVIGPNEQGFVTDTGRWVDRLEAAKIALAAGQLNALHSPPWLFSEDLW